MSAPPDGDPAWAPLDLVLTQALALLDTDEEQALRLLDAADELERAIRATHTTETSKGQHV